VIVAFERNLPTRGAAHAHIQVVAIPADLAALCRPMLEEEAGKLGFGFEEISTTGGALPARMRDSPYFLVETPSAEAPEDLKLPLQQLVYSTDSQGARTVPLQFGRAWLAKLLGNPAREDWKKCILERPAEEKLAADFKAAFKTHDFTLQ